MIKLWFLEPSRTFLGNFGEFLKQKSEGISGVNPEVILREIPSRKKSMEISVEKSLKKLLLEFFVLTGNLEQLEII